MIMYQALLDLYKEKEGQEEKIEDVWLYLLQKIQLMRPITLLVNEKSTLQKIWEIK